jgi:hypothetical protein
MKPNKTRIGRDKIVLEHSSRTMKTIAAIRIQQSMPFFGHTLV